MMKSASIQLELGPASKGAVSLVGVHGAHGHEE
jgi:hypothetical protein